MFLPAPFHVSLVVCAWLVQLGSAFSLYPTVDPDALASALNISVGCLDALNTTVDCDDNLFQWTVTVDDHWWETDNLTTLCTADCTSSASIWRSNAQIACVDDDLTIQGKLVPAASVAGRFAEGVGVACLQSNSSDWCQIESQNWVGSDVVRADCTVDPTDPSCSDSANVTGENARISNLYDNAMLCSDCFIKLFDLRLSSDYLPDDDYSDYLVDQLQDIQDVCSTTVGAVSTRYWAGYLDVATIASNATATSAASSGSSAAASTTGSATATTASVTTTSAVVTPTPTQPGMISNCNNFTLAESGDTCFSIATNYSITLSDFYTWNPAVGANCTTLFAGYYVCVGIQLPAGFTTSSSCQTIDFSYGVTTKDPTGACNQMSQLWNVTTGDFLVYTGDPGCYSDTPLCLPPPCVLAQVPSNATCNSLAASFSTPSLNVTGQMVLSWNPNIIGPCDNVTAAQYVCASAPGGSYSPPPNAPSDVSGGGQERGGPGGSDPTAVTGTPTLIVTSGINVNPTAAPAPTQAGIISTCNQYSQAKSGDTCSGFASNNDITTAQLYAWNSILGNGANCTNEFFAQYYYCVGTTGSGTITTTTSSRTTSSIHTSTSSAAAIPSPTQAGSIISTCNKYAQAPSGGTCSVLATANGITLAQLGQWNSVLGANGANCATEFFAGYYYCVGVSSSSTTTSTSASRTTSSAVSVPSPTQTGIISTCNKYVEAISGDYCYVFASDNGITTTQLYSWNTVLGAAGANCGTEFFAGYYYCVGVSGGSKKVRMVVERELQTTESGQGKRKTYRRGTD